MTDPAPVATAIHSRYGRFARPAPMLACVFARPAAPVSLALHASYPSWQIQPRLELTVVHQHAGGFVAAPDARRETAAAHEFTWLRTHTVSEEAETTLRHLFTRMVRHDSVAPLSPRRQAAALPQQAVAVPALVLPAAAPPVRILRSEPAAIVEAARKLAGHRETAAPAGEPALPRPVSRWPQPAVATPVDVGQITDQVMRAIDRRLVVHRERMGRV